MGPPLSHLSRHASRFPGRRDWYCLRRKSGTGSADGEFPRDGLIRLIDHPELLFRTHVRDVVKAGRTALVVRAEVPLRRNRLLAAYKRVQRRTLLKAITAFVRGNRTLRTWQLGRAFLKAGVPTARPLAVVVPRWFRPQAPSYILTEWINGGENLTQFAHRVRELPAPLQCRFRQAAAQVLGQLIGRMHAAGFSHRDLKGGNLLLVDRHGELTAFVIDLDGAAKWGNVPDRIRQRNITRLAVAAETTGLLTNTTRLRFLQAYLNAVGTADRPWQPLWRRLRVRVAAAQRRKNVT